jgi:pimeloyl-ACP methyl ester carboxylesterase
MDAAAGLTLQTKATDLLEVAFETGGAANGRPVLLLHGWPDDIRGIRGIAPHLHAAGFLTAAPYLRGFGCTRFYLRKPSAMGAA